MQILSDQNWKIMVMSDLIRQRIKQIYEPKNNNIVEILQTDNINEDPNNNNDVGDTNTEMLIEPSNQIQVGNENEEVNVEEVIVEKSTEDENDYDNEENNVAMIHFTVHQGMKERPDDTIA